MLFVQGPRIYSLSVIWLFLFHNVRKKQNSLHDYILHQCTHKHPIFFNNEHQPSDLLSEANVLHSVNCWDMSLSPYTSPGTSVKYCTILVRTFKEHENSALWSKNVKIEMLTRISFWGNDFEILNYTNLFIPTSSTTAYHNQGDMWHHLLHQQRPLSIRGRLKPLYIANLSYRTLFQYAIRENILNSYYIRPPFNTKCSFVQI